METTVEVVPFDPDHLAPATRLFIQGLRRIRRRVPCLPPDLGDHDAATRLLGSLLTPTNALVATVHGEMVGYLAWRTYASFRETSRRGAHSPEFGNAFAPGRSAAAFRALYRGAAERWAADGCTFQALTCLTGDRLLERALFESGFGMLVQDALRPLTSIAAPPPRHMTVRRATPADVEALAALEVEHRRHYAMAPILMQPPDPDPPETLERQVRDAPNAIWVAEGDGAIQGFLRFEPVSSGAVRVSLAPTTISITGAYVRPGWRQRGATTAMLAAAVDDYRERGFERMAVDYETTNPWALAFWPRFFSVVAISVSRVPESAIQA